MNVANMADRIVVIMMVIFRNIIGIPFGHLIRFLSILQQNLLVF